MTIDEMPAGRRMDRLIATLVLNRNLENYCVLSLHPDDGQCDGCNLPCALPHYSTDWRAMREVIDVLPFFNLRRLAEGEWQCKSAPCGNIFNHITEANEEPLCDCRFGSAETPELAICRAALKWAMNGEDE